jgi:peptidoglycan/LPS O-acetylase OafA/YrhL
MASIRGVDQQGRDTAVTNLEYPAPRERTKIANGVVVPVALTLASVIGLAMLLILGAAGYNDDGVWDDVSWQMYSLGAILAFLTGAAAYVVGRRRRDHKAMRMGLVGVAWFVIALLVVVIWEAAS